MPKRPNRYFWTTKGHHPRTHVEAKLIRNAELIELKKKGDLPLVIGPVSKLVYSNMPPW